MTSTIKFLATAALATTLGFSAFAGEAPAAKPAADATKTAEAPTVNTVLATVNGTDITLGHVIALRGQLPAQYQKLPNNVLLKGIVDQLIQQTVLMQSMEKKMDKRTTIGVENQKRTYLAGEMLARLSEYTVPEADIKAAYDAKYDGAIPEQEFNASHILVKTKAEADEIEKELKNGADFAKLAKEKSTGPSGKSGGELGWFGKGAMVPEFEKAVEELAVGEVSPPVKTQFGWHVVKLNKMRSKKVPTLEEARPDLTMQLQRKHVETELGKLTKEAKITRSEVKIDPDLIRDVSLFGK